MKTLIKTTHPLESKKIHIDPILNLQHLTYELGNILQSLEKKDKQRRKYAAKLKLQNKQNTEVIEAIGHEFKNPIAAIMGYSETIINDIDIDQKLLVKFLNKIYQNANSMSNMIDRLALAAKLESDMLKPKCSMVNIKTLIEDVVSAINVKYKNKNITVKSNNIQISLDVTMIKIVISNLIDNACKYGGNNIVVAAYQITNTFCISVSDDGAGINEEDIERLTQKFYRVKQNGWDNSLGLGLAIVEYLLKLHGSYLQIESKVGNGSKFWFELLDFKQ